MYVTHQPDEEYLEECLEPVFTQPSLYVMIWSCIIGGKGGRFNVVRYKAQVLEKVLKGFYAEMSKQRGEVLFMQDGVPCHCDSRTSQRC